MLFSLCICVCVGVHFFSHCIYVCACVYVCKQKGKKIYGQISKNNTSSVEDKAVHVFTWVSVFLGGNDFRFFFGWGDSPIPSGSVVPS